MAEPVMKNMAEGRLQQVMDTTGGSKNLELSPTWDNRDKKVAYMEAFGRLLAGLAPWRRTRQTLWGRCTDATPKLSTNDT
jgi:hypothetical protein